MALPIERERIVVTALVVLQLVLWLGFAVHRSPRFPGSLAGAVLAISGAALIVFPSLAYEVVKRIPSLKRRIGGRMPLRRLLAWHVYGGIVGSVLAILHTGHRFDSTLGMALTGVMLVSVFSGYAGRHFLSLVSLDVREKEGLLDQLITSYNEVAATAAAKPQPVTTVISLADSIAELEYAIKAHELLKRRFSLWLTVHVAASLAFYALLALHIWASIYFGLRWLA